MPVMSCNEKGKPGYKYGESGRCYTYTEGDESGRKKAKQKAYIQGAAISARTGEAMHKEDASIFQDILEENENLEKGINYDKFIDDGEGLIIEYPEKKEDVKKYNQNHDGESGKFTYARGGSGPDEGQRSSGRTGGKVPIGHEKCGPNAKNSAGQTISSVRATAGDTKGPCHQYVVGDKAS